jgi:hypothetical protein
MLIGGFVIDGRCGDARRARGSVTEGKQELWGMSVPLLMVREL